MSRPSRGKSEVSSRIRHNFSMAAKEAVHNVLKHARASQVTVYITLTGKALTVSIQDDGCGFQPADAQPGHGLVNMQRRLEGIGGSCLIESSPGQGTTVHLRLVVDSSVKNSPGRPALNYATAPSEASSPEKAD